MPLINENLQKEGKALNKEFRKFEGVFTQASRNAIPDGKFFHLENIQPIGDANLHTIADISSALLNYALHIIYWSVYVNINGTDYLLNFSSDGNIYAFNTGTLSSTLINSGTPLSGSGSRACQWKNSQALFIDSTGYYHWDGTTFALITGTGVPTAGTEIAVYASRVWIWNGRLMVIGDADDYTAAAFLAANGASFVALTDPTLRSVVTRAIACNGYLYFTGNSSINVVSNVYIPSGASPPAPLLTNTNIQSTVGSDQPGSFFTIDDRDLYFANRYGIYRLRGVTAERVSADIDGTWQYRDTTVLASGGAVNSNNLLNAAVLMKRLNDPVFGSNTVLCMYQNEKWWFANYGALTLVVGAIVNNQPALYGFIGNVLYQLFANANSAPTFTIKTALWPMEDALADKLVLKAGFEATVQTYLSNFSVTLDTVNGSQPFLTQASIGQITWINNSGAAVSWINNMGSGFTSDSSITADSSLTSDAVGLAGQTVTWFNGSYTLNWGTTPAVASKYVGLTVTGRAICEVSGFFLDYKIGTRWFGGAQ